MHEHRRRLDTRLDRLRSWVDRCPPDGWIRTIRTALGMSGAELGARIGVSQSRVSQIERGEVAGTLSLAGLERAADGLDCDVVYALVPRAGLERAVRTQALARALQVANAAAERQPELQEPLDAAAQERSALLERIHRHPAAAGKRLERDPRGSETPDAAADGAAPDPVQALADAFIDRRGLWSDDH